MLSLLLCRWLIGTMHKRASGDHGIGDQRMILWWTEHSLFNPEAPLGISQRQIWSRQNLGHLWPGSHALPVLLNALKISHVNVYVGINKKWKLYINVWSSNWTLFRNNRGCSSRQWRVTLSSYCFCSFNYRGIWQFGEEGKNKGLELGETMQLI